MYIEAITFIFNRSTKLAHKNIDFLPHLYYIHIYTFNFAFCILYVTAAARGTCMYLNKDIA